MTERVVLAYSGGLDTSVAIGWIAEETGAEVIAVAADVGQGGEDLEVIRQRALDCGAVEAVVADVARCARGDLLRLLRRSRRTVNLRARAQSERHGDRADGAARAANADALARAELADLVQRDVRGHAR